MYSKTTFNLPVKSRKLRYVSQVQRRFVEIGVCLRTLRSNLFYLVLGHIFCESDPEKICILTLYNYVTSSTRTKIQICRFFKFFYFLASLDPPQVPNTKIYVDTLQMTRMTQKKGYLQLASLHTGA